MAEDEGVWRTICGRRVFIRTGQSLSDALRESGKFQNVREDGPVFREPDAKEFKRIFDEAKATQPPEDAWRVDDTHTAEDYAHDRLFVTESGSAVAIEPSGNIISVCKNTLGGDRGSMLLRKAVGEGGDRLDAFGKKLFEFYTRNGFEPVSWTGFDERYAPHDWVKGRDKNEPVIFYRYTGQKQTRRYSEFLSAVKPSSDYDAAQEIRDRSMKKC